MIKKQLPTWIAKATNGVYHVRVENLHLSIWRRSIDAKNIQLWPDTDRINELLKEGHPPTTNITVVIPAIEISGLQLLNILIHEEISCNKLVIHEPRAFILSGTRLEDSLIKETPGSMEMNKERRSPAIRSLHADRITISDPQIRYLFIKERDSFNCDIKNGSIVLNDWTFDHNTEKNTDRFLYAGNCDVYFDVLKFYTHKPNGWRYTAHATGIYFNTKQNSLKFNIADFSASLIKMDSVKHSWFLKERDSISSTIVTIRNFDWKALMNTKQLKGDTLVLLAPVLDCYSNSTPSNIHVKNRYPQQFFQQIPLRTNISVITLSNGIVRYTEYNPKTDKKGIILFNEVSGKLSPVTNIRNDNHPQNNCIANFVGKYKSHSDVAATFYLNLTDTTGKFKLNATIKNVDAEQISKDAEALSLIRIKSGHVSRADIHLYGNEDSCKGDITMLYTNLELELEKTDGDKHIKNRRFVSTVISNLFLFGHNPMPDKEVRSATMYMDRKTTSFFELIWAITSEGVTKTVVRGEVAKKRALNAEEGKKKPGIIKRVLNRIIKH